MSHDLGLRSRTDTFSLAGSPDLADLGLGDGAAQSGNAGTVVKAYERYCRTFGWKAETWEGCGWLSSSCLPENDLYTTSPEWANPGAVDRHIAMVDAFLAFAPGARFEVS